jgi:hypothetical protein
VFFIYPKKEVKAGRACPDAPGQLVRRQAN